MKGKSNTINPFLEKLNKMTPPRPPSIDELDPLTCKKCGNSIFDRYFKMFKMSALKTASGKEQIFNIPVYICASCTEILDTNSETIDTPKPEKEKKKEKSFDKTE